MPEIVHGSAIQISPLVRRITAPNSGPMTASGTNTYLIGEQRVAVLDPGPAIPEHVEAILEAAEGRIEWIVVTHTHPDHSPAAALLAARSGAPMLGNTIADDGYQDQSFVSSRHFAHDQPLESEEFTLRAIATPGHVDNHLCFFLEEEGLLFTGDHLMNGSTVVIIPPHGKMGAYINSLRLIKTYPLKQLAPGHGDVIDDPFAIIDWTIQHRLAREQKVLQALSATPLTLEELTPLVYADVDESLHSWAKLSLWAHLIKLESEQHARCENELWMAA